MASFGGILQGLTGSKKDKEDEGKKDDSLTKKAAKKGLSLLIKAFLPEILIGVFILVLCLLISLAAYKIAQDNTVQVFFACGLDKQCAAEEAVKLTNQKANENVDNRTDPTPIVPGK